MTDKEIEYEKRKCVGCNLVYINNLIFSAPNEHCKNFVMCIWCASEVWEKLNKVKSIMDKVTN
jgi:hypothetical protein